MANQWLFDAGNFIAKRNESLITNYPFRLAKFAWKVVADLAFDYRRGDVNIQIHSRLLFHRHDDRVKENRNHNHLT